MSAYLVRRIGSAVLVIPTTATDRDAGEAELAEHAEALATLGDPTVLAQAVEAGYLEVEAEHVSNDEPAADDAAPA